MNERSHYGHGYTFPCLFKVGEDGWVLVSETGVDSRYCAPALAMRITECTTLNFLCRKRIMAMVR